MAKRTILIVGNSFSTLRDYLKAHGFDYIVLRDARLTKHPDPHKTFRRRVVCDFSSKAALRKTVDAIKQKQRVDGVIVIYENYIVDSAEIAEYLGLPGIPLEAAQACTDKWLMRQKFKQAPQKISPDFQLVKSEADVRNFAKHRAFPLILKPANLSKSLLVFKNHNLNELLTNYRRMSETIESVYATYAPGATPKILIEEFMEGPVHSVEAFVDESGEPHVLEQIVDYQTGYDIGYDDNFHYSRTIPSQLSPAEIADVRQVAAAGCRALGLKSTAAHVEIIRTAQGPRIVEIGARSGGYRPRMHALGDGIDITGNVLALALGQQPNLHATHKAYVGVFELFPNHPGLFKGIENESQLKALPSLNYYSLKAKPGTFVGKSSDGFKMCAVVILHNADGAQFAKDRAFLDTQVRVATN